MGMAMVERVQWLGVLGVIRYEVIRELARKRPLQGGWVEEGRSTVRRKYARTKEGRNDDGQRAGQVQIPQLEWMDFGGTYLYLYISITSHARSTKSPIHGHIRALAV